MAVLKAIVSLYRAGEEKPIERYKTRVKVAEENKLFSSFQKNVIEFLGLNEQAQKFGLGSFDLKFYCLTKINGKAENYAISTQQQLELELPFLLGSDGESSTIQGHTSFHKCWGSSSKVVQSIDQESQNSCRRCKRRSAARWDRKKLQFRSSARHLQCFRYTFQNGCCCREDQAYAVTGLSETTDFLEHLGILYDTFGITCKASTSQPITPEQVIQNLNRIDEYIKAMAMNVKETNNLKEDSTTNGPQGTVSQKTQTSIELLLNGVKSLMSTVTNVNPKYKDTNDWKTLLTTIVDNVHEVSHFKHETFDTLQYATDFGTISKESLKRITK